MTHLKTFLLLVTLIIPALAVKVHSQALSTEKLNNNPDSLLAVARQLIAEAGYKEALPVAQAARSASLEYDGPEHPGTLPSLDLLGFIHARLGNFKEAESNYLEAVHLREQLRQNDSLYADNLNRLGTLYKDKGRLNEAEDFYLKASQVYMAVHGPDHVAVAGVYVNLGQLYRRKSNHSQAEKYFLQAKSLLEELNKTGHPYYKNLLISLGILYTDREQLNEAESNFQQALDIHLANGGEKDHSYSIILESFNRLYNKLGYYRKALPMQLEVVDIREKVFGKSHPNYAKGLYNLANLYYSMGLYRQSESLFHQAKDIFAVNPGKMEGNYAACLMLLTNLYKQVGVYDLAEKYVLEAHEIILESQGKESSLNAVILNDMGGLYLDWDKWDLAETTLLKAKEIRAKLYGENSTRYASTIGNLAILNHKKGDLDQAASFARATLEIFKAQLGPAHPNYAIAMDVMGGILQSKGDQAAALDHYQKALAIKLEARGPDHPGNLETLSSLSNLFFQFDQPDSALLYFRQASDLRLAYLERGTGFLSDEELRLLFKKYQSQVNDLFSFCQEFADHPGSAALAYKNILFFKAFFLDHIIELNNLVENAEPEVKNLYSTWQSVQQEMGVEYARPPGQRGNLEDLSLKANELEKELARKMNSLSVKEEPVSWQQIQSVLGPRDLAIEFVRFEWNQPEHTDSVWYAALLLRPDWIQPKWVRLFEERQLSALVNHPETGKTDYVNQLFAGKPGEDLYSLIWEPLEPFLENVHQVFFSPAGLLHRIPVPAIHTPGGDVLVNRFTFHQLNSTRHLVNRKDTIADLSGAELFGGIQYEFDSTALAAANEPHRTDLVLRTAEDGSLPEQEIRSIGKGNKPWKYLPWTEVEVKIITTVLHSAGIPAHLYTGYHASEEIFKSLGGKKESPAILHVATHGYFFPDPGHAGAEESVFRLSDHPMIRSGIILSGSNHAWTGNERNPGLEDGILTAYEVAQLDLSETELVVLSACETGLGEIAGNEGVFGLQRAFKIAGVKYLLMSLWQVPDFVTQELMTAFYTNWLIEKMQIQDAFRKAQSRIRQQNPDPFYWAGFVLVE